MEGNNVVAKADMSNAKIESGKASTTKGRGKCKNDLDAVLEKARAVFKHQLVRDAKTKRLVVEKAIQNRSTDYTSDQFLTGFINRIALVLDSKSFDRECKSRNLEPFAVATHLAFEGITKTRLVQNNGLVEVEQYLSEMEEPIYTYQDLERLDSAGKLKEYAPQKS